VKSLKYIFILFIAANLNAQQLPIYSQYMMNRFLINPAMAGAEGYTSFNLTAREQWLGLENAPRTQALSGQTRLLRNSHISRGSSVRKRKRKASTNGKVGVGGYIFNDVSGIIRKTGFQATYAYHLNTRTSQMSFGLSASGFQYKINDEKLVLYDEYYDPLLYSSKRSAFVPDANFGFYYVNQKMDVGFSVLQMLQSALKIGGSDSSNYQLYRHYYLNGGFRYSPRRDYLIEPTALLTWTKQSFQIDIGARVFYQQNYWGGITYRAGDNRTWGDIVFQGGIKVNNFLFGYAFDYTIYSAIRQYTLGSHEIMMAVKIGDNARRYRWLNRY
jgi:type IX secretion system PorP/SprF family membrane protein